MRDPIIIIGGGIGGLSLAHSLLHSGFPVQVLERAPALAPVGAGISLGRNALFVMKRLQVYTRLVSCGSWIYPAMATASGRVLSRSDDRKLRTLCLHRADLLAALAESLPTGTIELGRWCQGFEQDKRGVTARFADGMPVRGTVLVGADGIHSMVRAALSRPGAARYAGYTCWRGVQSGMAGELKFSGEIWGRGKRFGVLPIGRGRVYWYATHNGPAGLIEEPEDRKGMVAELFEGWSFDVPKLIDATPDASIIQHDIIDRAPISGWSKGRVVLLGDAIHPTTPNLGQGAAMAIEDAAILGRLLGRRRGHSAAFKAYERIRSPRTSMVTERSWKMGAMGQLDDPLACWLRNRATGLMPAAMQVRALRAMVDYDATSVDLD